MRPHRLELQAFGAFPHRVELDLDALGQNGLLLLCGDTGGGKTTLLDALGFALYGVVPGERAKARDELRSHHAAPGDPTWVRLEFTARGRRLRVTRTPEQLRPAKRGGGVTKEQASARLEQWDGERWEPVAQRLDEVGLEVGRLVGMDAAQFFQVVLLPQGRFAAFLQADHKERERLLKQLFAVDRFGSAERWLAERAAEAATRLDAAQRALADVAARVAQEADAALPEDLEATPGWAAELAAAAAEEHARCTGQAAALLADRGELERALASALDLARRQGERRAAEQHLAALQDEVPALAPLAAELEAADRAVPVAVAAAAARARRQDAAARADQKRDARAALGRLGVPAPDGVQELRATAAAARTDLGRLELLRDVEARAEAAEAAAAAAQADAVRATARAEEAAAALAALAGARPLVEQRRDDARAATAALPAAQRRLEAAQEQRDRAEQAAAARAEADRSAALAAAARTEHERLDELARDLRVQRVDAMAAELARRLVDDDECPVCGSLDHPAPAEVRADHVTPEREREAEQAAAAAAVRAGEVAAAAAAAAERAAVLAEHAPVVAEDLPALAAEAARLGAVAADLPAAEAAVSDHEEQVRALREQQLTASLQAQEAARAAGTAADAAAADRARVAAALEGARDLTSRLAAVGALADAAERAAAATEAAQAAARTADDAASTAVSLAAAAGFSSPDDAAAAARDDAWREDARSRLQVHRDRLAAVQARLADHDLAVPLDPPAPVPTARDAAAAAAAAHEQAVAQEGLAAERARRLAALVPSWEAASTALPPLREAAAERKGLAELAAGRGANRLSMPLSTFVLAARLEEVAAAATVRLQRMTDGRYTLMHTDGSRDRRSRAGLGLQVEDTWTGRLRDTATLSGGETFMTALSLALGLADVVTAEAGGQTIDALFVDEGFGSLDASTLDTVMDVLDELRSGGRLVGLVSHVADLRLRIPTQVLVDKGTAGSRVRTTLTAA
jgi:DNA repair protein SbcC/Rad50